MNKKIFLQTFLISLFIASISVVLIFSLLKKNNSELIKKNTIFISNVILENIKNNKNNVNLAINYINNIENIKNASFSPNNSNYNVFLKNKIKVFKGKITYTFLKNDFIKIRIPLLEKNKKMLGHITFYLKKQNMEFKILYYIFATTIMVLFLILFPIVSRIKKQNNFLIYLENVMAENAKGNFKELISFKETPKKLSILINNINNFISSYKKTTFFINKELSSHIGMTKIPKTNDLKASRDIIKNLSNLFQFKKTIELDDTKEKIYNRLASVLKNKFNVKNFVFLEVEIEKKEKKVILSNGNTENCNLFLQNNYPFCKTIKTKSDNFTIKNYNYSLESLEDKKYRYCFSTEISKNNLLVIHTNFCSEKELNNFKKNISIIKSYAKESSSAIEIKNLMDKLKISAFRDNLTGLYNRTFMEAHCKKIIPYAIRKKYKIGVLLLDIDHFKAVNDEYGHDIGDKVLKTVAEIISKNTRESDIAIRYGGEEFLVLLLDIQNNDNAFNVANKIKEEIRNKKIKIYKNTTLQKTISIGISTFPDDSNLFNTVIKNSDMALYEAKNKGRDQIQFFTPELYGKVELF